MVGKVLLLLAAASVCLAQAPGDNVDAAIKRGISRANYIYESGQKQIEAAVNEVSYRQKLIQSKTASFVQRAQKNQEEVERALSGVAEAMREKARETKKPQSVFECIDRVEGTSNKNIETLTQKFKGDMERLERVKLENIATYAKPLETMPESLKERHEKAVSIIKECKNPKCVDIAVNSFRSWLDMLSTEMRRVRSQINVAINNYQRDANTYFGNTNRQVNRIKSTAMRNIKQCIFNREAFEEFLGF